MGPQTTDSADRFGWQCPGSCIGSHNNWIISSFYGPDGLACSEKEILCAVYVDELQGRYNTPRRRVALFMDDCVPSHSWLCQKHAKCTTTSIPEKQSGPFLFCKGANLPRMDGPQDANHVVRVVNVNVLDNPTSLTNPFQFEIIFESSRDLLDGAGPAVQ